MRVDVTRWNRINLGRGYVEFRIDAEQIYLNSAEVSIYNMRNFAESIGQDAFRLTAHPKVLDGAQAAALTSLLHAEEQRQEDAKNAAEGNLPPLEERTSIRDINEALRKQRGL